jgi:dinuclear metal center YbgI/SA1388 family protein
MLRAMSRTLAELLALLEQIAPLNLAADWDNVGLLVEPGRASTHNFERLFLCIDLNDEVLAEAVALRADFVVAYHPPIFRGLKRLRASAADERVLVRALEAGIAVYSPHTALDATPNGVNDWLARGVGSGRCTPLVPDAKRSDAGAGRLLELDTPTPLRDIVSCLKAHLGVDTLRLAERGAAQVVSRAALCAGAGGSLFERVHGVDLFVTGEMRHHDVLEKVRSGSSVILAEHTHTERGFLPELSQRLNSLTNGQIQVLVSARDADPLRTV